MNRVLDSCPLGIVDIDGSCNFKDCRNREYCRQQTDSWPLPFERWYDDYLIYLRVQVREKLLELDQWWEEIADVGGAYGEYLDGEAARQHHFLARWVTEVEKAGWIEAEPLPYCKLRSGGIAVVVYSPAIGFYAACEIRDLPEWPGVERWNDIPDLEYLADEIIW